jgi:uncharacterized membrane protein YbhN (UPF0104 family)
VIERLLDGLTVVACLGMGLLVAGATTRPSRLLLEVLAVGALLFGGGLVVLLALSGSILSRGFSRFPSLAARLALIESGLRVLRTRRAVRLALATVVVYVPDTLSLWLLAKAIGVSLGLADVLGPRRGSQPQHLDP